MVDAVSGFYTKDQTFYIDKKQAEHHEAKLALEEVFQKASVDAKVFDTSNNFETFCAIIGFMQKELLQYLKTLEPDKTKKSIGK